MTHLRHDLLILGASARAAAFSALRAGFRPWCADLFRDHDLQAVCDCQQVDSREYPRALLDVVANAPSCPWIYTGRLENWPRLVTELAKLRPLWGTGEDFLRRARSPLHVASVLREAGLPCPDVRLTPHASLPQTRWLQKPIRGTDGAICFLGSKKATEKRPGTVYFQEYIAGDACAAVFLGNNGGTQLLGVTRQLVGEGWLRARPFTYCGSIGPLRLEPSLRRAFDSLGNALARGCGLRGLFGVDCVLRDGIPWPVEINPRYTASTEVLEYATGWPALDGHRRIFEATAPEARAPRCARTKSLIGKAILFAKAPLVFPADGPWTASLCKKSSPFELPSFADIPAAGQRIEPGQPILTLFAHASTPSCCLENLKAIARELDHWLHDQ